MKYSIARRARWLGAGFTLFALLLVTRLYFIQVVHGGEYREDAVSQYQVQDSSTLNRGKIFFTTKDGAHVEAALMRSGWRIAIQPKLVIDAQGTYAKLASILPLDKERLLAAAAKKDDPYEEVAYRLSDAQAESVRALKLPGVLLVADQWRDYPGGTLAAQVLGFVGYQGDKRAGTYGLERYYDDTLTEATGGLYVNPFAEIFSNVSSILASDPADHQGSIITSIEPRVQQQLETTLQGVMKTYSSDFAGGIVMDPHTGAIIAIGGLPSFDPNDYGASPLENYGDKLVEGRYELGSIMKPLTMAAGIDSGAVTLQTTYNDTGCITVSTYKVCNFDGKARGVIPMQEILSQSLNVGASFVATKTGYPVFTQYMQAYGFGQKTGIDLPNEVTGDLHTLSMGQKPAVNYDTASFGQGVSVSPIEMIRALSTLANEGALPNPHVVTGIQYESGVTRSVPVPPSVPVLKPASAETVTNMLITVFDTGLLHGALKQDHYSIAAKTGTAQIPKPGGGYYPNGTFLHSFFGYFPAHDPKFIVFLFVFKPRGQEYASATLAHPFMDIASFLINYYDIPPDR